MVIGKKTILLLACAAALVALLLTSVGSTYAYTNSISADSGLSLEFSVKTGENSYTLIEDDSKNSIFSSDLRWEPGSMHIATLKVENTADSTGGLGFNFWIYPHTEKQNHGITFLTDAEDADLADVLEVYLYEGDYTDKQRPDLSSGNSSWVRLGRLSDLPPEEKPDAPLGALVPGESAEYTLLLKMDESAGNEYQGKTIDAYISLMAEMIPESA